MNIMKWILEWWNFVDGLIAAYKNSFAHTNSVIDTLPGYIQHLITLLAVLKVPFEFCILSLTSHLYPFSPLHKKTFYISQFIILPHWLVETCTNIDEAMDDKTL